jgi:hypothetical protein
VFLPNPSGSELVAAGSIASRDCYVFDAGAIDNGSYYRLCRTPSGQLQVTRVRLDGTTIDTHDLSISLTDGGVSTTRTADALFIWDSRARRLTRFDFATGAVTTGVGQTASVPGGVVDRMAALGRQLGHLIAPSAVAKDLLFPGVVPGVVASPNGRRIFALGVKGENGAGNSTGIDAFDADTLAPLWHAEPTRDFSSIAVNADGTAVYASAHGASITVFDGASGQTRLLAGQIGQPGTNELWFTEPVLR